MRVYIPLILIMTALIGFIVWVFIYTGTPTEIKNEGSTIGTIIQFQVAGKTSGREAIIEYDVDGKKYEVSTIKSAYGANVIGERFEIKYDKETPSKAIVLTYNPVFLETEETQIVRAVITRLYRFAWGGGEKATSHAIEFEYEINNVKYKKSQNLPPDFKLIYPDLKDGSSYKVRYWINNPNRAVIYINEPA